MLASPFPRSFIGGASIHRRSRRPRDRGLRLLAQRRLGFVYLFGDIQKYGLGIIAHLPREYTLGRDVNLQWLKPCPGIPGASRSTPLDQASLSSCW